MSTSPSRHIIALAAAGIAAALLAAQPDRQAAITRAAAQGLRAYGADLNNESTGGAIPSDMLTKSAAATGASIASASPLDRIGALRLDTTRVGAAAELQRQALLVVQAHPVGTVSSHDTGRRSGGRDVLHYVQRLQPVATLKGRLPAELRLVLSGLHPLPAAKDPANEAYPGPLADGEAYVLFLRPTGVPGMYTSVGGWQGIYPLDDEGRTIALAGAGFRQFGGLTPDELKARLHAAP